MSATPAASIVLASASTARLALLENAGIVVRSDPAGIDEDEVKASFRAARAGPELCAAALAAAKASRVSQRHAGSLVIGADQLLVADERWFDKPQDLGEARAQLRLLRGRSHELVTAVAVALDGAVIWRLVDRPRLVMRGFSDAFLDAYLAVTGDEVLAVVGAYRLEGRGIQLFERIDGDYFSILGLPLLPLLEFLRGHGVIQR